MPVKNIIPGQTVTKEKLQRARELRRDMTPAEKILWQELRGNKLGEKTSTNFLHEYSNGGHQFVNSFPFVDGNSSFILPNSSLFLQQEEDARREKVLSEMGLRMVRFRNDEVMKNLSAVVGKIRGLVA